MAVAQPKYAYLHVCVQLSPAAVADAFLLKSIAVRALRSTYGSSADGVMPLDVLHFQRSAAEDEHEHEGVGEDERERSGDQKQRHRVSVSSHRALLRARYRDAAAVRAALTLLSSYDRMQCRISVREASPFLPMLQRVPAAAAVVVEEDTADREAR